MPLFAGKLLLADATLDGWLEADGGRVVGWGEGEAPRRPDATGWIVPAPVNAHTHVADAFLRDTPGKPIDVASLVGPGGFKQRHLASASPEALARGIDRYTAEMAAIGTTRFLDFREGGLPGVRLLRQLAADLPVQPTILGRPMRNDFQDDEARALLAEADGVGLSARRDFADPAHVEAWAEACHRARKPFALHVSEAVHEDLGAVLALEPSFLVHAAQCTDREMRDLADAEVPVVVCPRSNQYHGFKVPLDRLRRAGVRVAAGTDNGMLQDGNLLSELALLQSWFPTVPTDELLRMACWTGRALAGLPAALPPKRGQPLDVVVLPAQPWTRAGTSKPQLGVPEAPPAAPAPQAAGPGAP